MTAMFSAHKIFPRISVIPKFQNYILHDFSYSISGTLHLRQVRVNFTDSPGRKETPKYNISERTILRTRGTQDELTALGLTKKTLRHSPTTMA